MWYKNTGGDRRGNERVSAFPWEIGQWTVEKRSWDRGGAMPLNLVPPSREHLPGEWCWLQYSTTSASNSVDPEGRKCVE